MISSKYLLLQKLYLCNFRRYEEILFQFNPVINPIIGPNAHGKTTILEAIQFLICGRSFRTQQTPDLIQYGKDFFYIEATFIKQEIEQTLKISYDGKERKIIHNSTPLHSSANLLGLLQGVIVSPDHVSLIKGSPLIRRHFLDLQIAQVDPLYVHHLTRYARAMRQRNVLLRGGDLNSIRGWEQEMAISAAYITIQRKQAITDLQRLSNVLHALLTSETDDLTFDYKCACNNICNEQLQEHYLLQWNKIRNKEKELGMTVYGPHRDDFVVKIRGREARLFASEGEQRTCLMVLRLAEWQRLYTLSQEKPLMLIDDIGISLDSSRRQKLFSHLKNLGQVFLTSTEELRGV